MSYEWVTCKGALRLRTGGVEGERVTSFVMGVACAHAGGVGQVLLRVIPLGFRGMEQTRKPRPTNYMTDGQ